jgi:hypothetical protein
MDGVSQGKAAASIDANNNYTSITFKADGFFILENEVSANWIIMQMQNL